MHENRSEHAEVERLRSRVAALEAESRGRAAHAEALDRNWQALHDLGVGAFRDALGMPDASIPEMVREVRRLQSFESVLKN